MLVIYIALVIIITLIISKYLINLSNYFSEYIKTNDLKNYNDAYYYLITKPSILIIVFWYCIISTIGAIYIVSNEHKKELIKLEQLEKQIINK